MVKEQPTDPRTAPADAPGTPESGIREIVRRYMAESMAMKNPFEDQEQNWILGHMATLVSQQVASLTADLTQPQQEIVKLKRRAFVKAGESFTAELWGDEFNGDPIEVRLRGETPAPTAQT